MTEAGPTFSEVDRSQRRRLSIVLGLNVGALVAMAIAWSVCGSLMLLVAGADYLADILALGLGLVAVALRARSRRTSRAPAWVALGNAGALLVLSLVVLVESCLRVSAGPPRLDPQPMIWVGGLTAVVMTAAAMVLSSEHDDDLHMRSVLLDTVADAVSSFAAAAVGVLVAVTGGFVWLDPVLAGGIAVVVGVGAVRLGRDAIVELRLSPTPADAAGAQPDEAVPDGRSLRA